MSIKIKPTITKYVEDHEQEEAPIQGDLLEIILSHVSLIDLLPALHVSNTWKRAVSLSLSRLNTIKPWLIVHTQNTRSPHLTSTHAYDPRSHVWIEIQQPSIGYISALRSSHSTLLYMLSSSKFVFSNDPLYLTWHDADTPLSWRADPIVAQVGPKVIIGGRACEFYDDDPHALEIYDTRTHTRESCKSMPIVIKESASSTWLYVAADEHKMYVTEKCSGTTYLFDPFTKTWHGPYDLHSEREIFTCAIGFTRDRLIVLGLVGQAENVKNVKLWEARGENLECKLMGEMPTTLIEKLKGESASMPSIEMTSMGDFVYIHNPLDPREIIVCEVVHGECCWGSVRNVVVDDRMRMQRLTVTCSDVRMRDIERALSNGDRRFVLKM